MIQRFNNLSIKLRVLIIAVAFLFPFLFLLIQFFIETSWRIDKNSRSMLGLDYQQSIAKCILHLQRHRVVMATPNVVDDPDNFLSNQRDGLKACISQIETTMKTDVNSGDLSQSWSQLKDKMQGIVRKAWPAEAESMIKVHNETIAMNLDFMEKVTEVALLDKIKFFQISRSG